MARPPPLVIGHRGAAGARPDHTIGGYRYAIAAGADFIEPDLVLTKDGVLIDRHENEIGATTDVAAHPEFAGRNATKVVDGQTVTGWFSEDFTLADIRMLKARERLPELRPGNTVFDGQDGVLTFQEVIDLARTEGARAGRPVGIYAELKHPTYVASIGPPMEARFVEALKRNDLARRDAPLFFQCFELASLRTVRAQAPVRGVFLMDQGAPADFVATGDPRGYGDLTSPQALAEIARVVDGIGPAKTLIIPGDALQRSLPPTTLVRDAHAAGLLVHPFTFRSENNFLPAELRRGDASDPAFARALGDAQAEYLAFFALGVDGVFSDFPDHAVAARRAFMAR